MRNFAKRFCYAKKEKNGLTFIEVLVTLVILSVGIVVIFKSFLISLNHINYLTSRLYATTILDNRISHIERMLKIYKTIPFELNYVEEINTGSKRINFKQKMDIENVTGITDVFRLDLSLIWEENSREVQLSRTAYISGF